jgi:hypothetical protein
MQRPSPEEYAPHFHSYISLVPDGDIRTVLERQLAETLGFFRGVTEAQGGQRHPPYTWSIKEVVGHLTDCERIFGYRALRFARGDSTPLPGFDENAYMPVAQFDRLPLAELVRQFEAVRRSHILLFGAMPEEAWSRRGEANSDGISVRALAYAMAGHELHHMAIVRKRLAQP